MTKLPDILLIGASALFLIIGIDQSIVLGFDKGYWAFMLSLAAFFGFTYRKGRRANPVEEKEDLKAAKKSRKRK